MIRQQSFGSLAFVHLAVSASRLANADHRSLVGDPAYSNVDERIQAMLSHAYLDKRALLIKDSRALSEVSPGTAVDDIPDFVKKTAASYPAMANHRPIRLNSDKQSTYLPATQGEPLDAQNDELDTTSHLAVVDGYGNALSMTTTINSHWGAHIEAAGMILNDALSNFSIAHWARKQMVLKPINARAPRSRHRWPSTRTVD